MLRFWAVGFSAIRQALEISDLGPWVRSNLSLAIDPLAPDSTQLLVTGVVTALEEAQVSATSTTIRVVSNTDLELGVCCVMPLSTSLFKLMRLSVVI